MVIAIADKLAILAFVALSCATDTWSASRLPILALLAFNCATLTWSASKLPILALLASILPFASFTRPSSLFVCVFKFVLVFTISTALVVTLVSRLCLYSG